MIADKRSASGWSWGCLSTVKPKGRTIFVAAQMPNERATFRQNPTRIRG
jgi:hypothetical protein